MTFSLDDTLDRLQRTPAALDGLLRGGSDSWNRVDEGPGTWSAFDVVGHLIHAEETNWIPRARLILESGDSRPLGPFDRFAHLERFGGCSLDDLLDRFAGLRAESLRTVRGWELGEERLHLRGRHPELGTVTLRELLATWAVHDLDHIAQVVRVMARRYAGEVGAWREYLSILRR